MTVPNRWDRRTLLRGGAVAFGGAGVGWLAGGLLPDAGRSTTGQASGTDGVAASTQPSPGRATVAFHGPYQAGIDTPPQVHLSLVGLDLIDGVDTEGLVRLMRLLSDDVARLTRGLPALADTEPELAATPARLTVTFGFGPRVLDQLVPGQVGRFVPLPRFATDRLRDEWAQTDLAVQICADDPLTVAHARRMLLKDAAAFVRTRWIQDGFRHAVGSVPDGATMRNVMGQVDGTSNPSPADRDFDDLIWSTTPGFEGGTYMVVRRIRAELARWDHVDRVGREETIGRRLDNGAPLTGSHESDPPDLDAVDDLGLPVIDPASHLARARTDDPRQRFLRRPYNYTVADRQRPGGEDAGLVFIVYAADVARQFVPIQQRLAEQDRLNRYITTIGSAVYAVPPGAREGEFVGQRMLEG